MAEHISYSSDRISNYSREQFECRLNPIAQVLLQGIYDEHCELHKLIGMWHILQKIWREIIFYWKKHIRYSRSVDPNDPHFPAIPLLVHQDGSFFSRLQPLSVHRFYQIAIVFPKPSRLNINMMPFVMENTFRKSFLPKCLKGYWKELIRKCPIGDNDIGKVGYLTIQENFVDIKNTSPGIKNTSQGRLGIRTEKPGRVTLHDTEENRKAKIGCLSRGGGYSFTRAYEPGWGGGLVVATKLSGGIFMASTEDNSCRIWDCRIMDDDLIGELGDVDHLREFLYDGKLMKKNELHWITDKTPNEFLPLEQGMYRQYFKLVTSQMSLWYEEHSTNNPLGVIPDPSITRIVTGSRSDTARVIVVDEVYSNKDSPGKKRTKKLLKLKIK